MNILCFDTALNKTYVSLSDNDKILCSKIIENTEDNYHSAFLISTIKSVLKENNFKPKDIELIGVNVGPGSFTGIRAALTVAKIMAQEIGIKIVPVCSLKILSKLAPENKTAFVILDARRNMAYTYKNKVEIINIDEVKFDNDSFIIADKSMAEKFGLENCMIYENETTDLGRILNKITYEEKDSALNPMELKALYIQPPPVNTK